MRTSKKLLNQALRGFSVVEVLLAIAMFSIIAVVGVTTVLHSFSVNRLGEEETQATSFAQEGMDAVRSIRDQNWSNLAPGTYGLAAAGNIWQFSGTSDGWDKYTRQVVVSAVGRDGSGNIISSGGTTDPDTMKVDVAVDWNFTDVRPGSVGLSDYFTNFRKAIGGTVLMAYSKTTATPFYRTWDGTSWSLEASAQIVGGNINYIVLKTARSRNEAILGTLDSGGNIYAQVWNGSTWGTPTLMASIGSALAIYRSFDIDYEESGDRAVFAYLPNSTAVDPAYRIWDGSSWSSPTTVSSPPTTGVIRWIELSQNPAPTSNEIALVMLDANADVYGMAWDGSTWGNMGVGSVWDATAATAARKAIDVAYEQSSGRAMFMWGDSVATDQYYRIWNGTTLTSATLLDIAASGGVANWIELVSRPSSNELMYGVQDAGSDLNTRKWSGSSWDTATQHPEHDASVENATSMNFDLIWETHPSNPGRAWLMWGNGATVSKKQWSGSSWGASSVLTGSDDASFVRLKADPDTGAVFAGIYENSTSATDDLWESHLTGGGTAWSAENTLWGGPTSADPVYFRIDISTP